MRRAFESEHEMPPNADDINAVLSRASRYLCFPCTAPGVSTLEVLSHDGGFYSVHSLRTKQQDSVYFTSSPIKIEFSEPDIDIDSTIVLHNFATVQLCLSRVFPTLAGVDRLRQGAYTVATMAHATLSIVLTEHNPESSRKTILEMFLKERRAILVVAAVIQTIAQILDEAQLYDIAQEYHGKLALLGSFIHQVVKAEGSVAFCFASAAAA
jgi:hypothetical protein